jgi:cell division protein FtsB
MKSMKKLNISVKATIALFAILGLSLTSCETKQDVKTDIDQLRNERSRLSAEIESLDISERAKKSEISDLEEKLKVLNIYKSGKTPKYILKMHLKQSHFSLSIRKHIKDAMNAIDFEIPVDKDFYNSVSVGTEIVDNFRTGSFLLYGSFGDWEMTVDGKEIR